MQSSQQTFELLPRSRLGMLVTFLFVLLVCLFGSLAYLLSGLSPHVILHATVFLAALALTYVLVPERDQAAVTLAFVVGYLVRFAAIYLIHQLSPNGLLLLDDQGYDEQGRFLASNLSLDAIRSATADLGTLHTGYPILVAIIYRLAGVSVLSAKLLNATFGALCVLPTYWLAAEFTDNRTVAIGASWITCFFLYDVGWSGYLLKDTLLLLLFSGLAVAAVRFVRTKRIILVALILVLLFVVSYFRIYATAIFCAAAVFAAAIQGGRRIGRSAATRSIVIATVVLGIALLAAAGLSAYSDSVGILTWYSATLDSLDTTGLTPLHFSLTPTFLLQMSHASVVYLLGPFAWVFSNVSAAQAVFYPGMYLIYFLLPFFLLGFGKLLSQHRWAATFIVLCYVFHAAVEIYLYQSGERQRMMTDAIFVTCAALGWYGRKAHARFIASVYFSLVVLAIAQSVMSL